MAVKNFTELTSGKSPSEVRVAAVSTGSFELYLSLDLEGAMAFAVVVSTIIGGFVAIGKTRKLREEMVDGNFPKVMIKGAEDHEAEILNSAVAQAASEAIELAAKGIDRGRLNELKTAIRHDVHFIAKSISEGVDVEVTPPQLPEGTADESDTLGIKDHAEKINSLSRTLTDRTAPLAELPDPDAKPEGKRGRSAQPRPRKSKA